MVISRQRQQKFIAIQRQTYIQLLVSKIQLTGLEVSGEIEQVKVDKNNNRILFTQQMKLIPLILFGATVLAIYQPVYTLQTVSEQVVKNIFTQNQIYMIYVTEDHDLIMQSYFNEYCNEGNLCAILDKSSDLYDELFQYIGRKKSEFFVILDAARKLKFVMPVIENMTAIDIRIFLAKFQQGLLQPFYASQKPEINSYPPCRKVVGKNVDQFVAHEAPLKVLYLYSDYKYCQECGEILRSFADFAEKTYDPQMIIFGYYNVLMNDHEMIKDENYPHFLIFTSPNEKPIHIESGSLPKLQQKIVELVTSKQNVKIKRASQPSSQSSGKEEIQQQL